MAGGFVAPTATRKEYAGRVTAFVVVACLVSATGGLIFGYDLGISGGVTSMDPFLKKFFPNVFRKLKQAHTNAYCRFDDQLLTTFTSSLYIAGLIASFFASATTRILGRKMSILFGGLIFLTGAALNGAAVNVVMLILGRICLGIGVGFGNQVEPGGAFLVKPEHILDEREVMLRRGVITQVKMQWKDLGPNEATWED